LAQNWFQILVPKTSLLVLIFGSKLVPDFGTKIPLLVLNFGSKLVPDFGTKISLLVLIFGSKLVPDFGTKNLTFGTRFWNQEVDRPNRKKLADRTGKAWPIEHQKVGQLKRKKSTD
jgi:hypothetical protein